VPFTAIDVTTGSALLTGGGLGVGPVESPLQAETTTETRMWRKRTGRVVFDPPELE
jgi:hypothetical protein